MLLDTWAQVGRTIAVGAISYAALVLLLRISGKRTLAKLSAFDLVVTVAFGSTLATILLSSEVAVAEGVAALATLVGAQLLVALATSRWPAARRTVRARPAALLRSGVLDEAAMRAARVSAEEVLQAVRSAGIGDLALVSCVALEADGTLSVVSAEQAGSGSALADL